MLCVSVYRIDAEFTKALKNYVDHAFQKDSVALNTGDSEMNEFTQLLQLAAAGVKRYFKIKK